MKYVMMLSLILSNVALADTFEQEARILARDLKEGLVIKLKEQIAQKGAVEAIPFCHENVGPIAKGVAGNRIAKFEFGRTSHKVRNIKNAPALWMEGYLKEFVGKNKKEIKKEFFIHRLPDGKRVYVEPLYVQPLCLQCHGEGIDPEMTKKLTTLYPQDKATGFKLNEFRGFIWVKEK